MLGLLEIPKSSKSSPRKILTAAPVPGETMLVFKTDDIFALKRKMNEAGFVEVLEPVQALIPGRSPGYEMFALDPNGVRLNFIQFGS